MRFRYLLLLFLCLLPLGAYAGAFSVLDTDKSMQYLGGIFGAMGTLPVQGNSTLGTNTLFPALVSKFNVIIFTLGIVIIAWTTMVGTISTAQEGEVLGKKFSSIWIPARVGFGMYLLLPSGGNGYSLLQIGVMWMIIQGVGAANAIWKEIVMDPNSIHSDTRKAKLAGSLSQVQTLFKSALCMERINGDSNLLNKVGGESIQVYPAEDSDGYYVLNIGFISKYPDDPEGAQLCGQVGFPHSPPYSDNQSGLAYGAQSAISYLQGSAWEALNLPQTDWGLYNNISVAIDALESAFSDIELSQNFDSVKAQSVAEGWIHAGSFYSNIAGGFGGGGVGNMIGQYSIAPPTGAYDKFFGTGNNVAVNLSDASSIYISKTNQNFESYSGGSTSIQQGQLSLQTSFSAGGAQSAMNAIFGSLFNQIVSALQRQISQGNSASFGDPVISMASFGSEVVSIIEIVFWVGLGLAFLVWLGSGIMCSIQPLCNTMNFVMGIVMSVAGLLISLLYVGALTMALYVPMIPYLVFTFSALTWVILVIEAILAAPLVGLTLVMPSEDELGKASNGIVILFGLFLRPPLMIVGFLFSVKLLYVAFAMLNYGFMSTIMASTANNRALFASIAVFTMYVGLCIALVHECFTLIYKVPDQVLRWIGSSSGGGDEMSKVKGVKGSFDKGAGISKGVMSGINKKVGEKVGSKGGIGV